MRESGFPPCSRPSHGTRMTPVGELEQMDTDTRAAAPSHGGGEAGNDPASRIRGATPATAVPLAGKSAAERDGRLVLRLGISFALLTMLTVSCWVGWRTLGADAHLEKSLTERREKLQLIYEALRCSSENTRIAMNLLLNQATTPALLARRGLNRQKITGIVAELERQADSEKERGLIAAVKQDRMIYLDADERAIKLRREGKREVLAAAVIFNDATPSLFAYHGAWQELAGFELAQMQISAGVATEHDRITHRVGLSLQILAMLIVAAIAVFTTRRVSRYIKLSVRMQREVADLNARLEQRVAHRTDQLARAQGRLQESLEETREYAGEIEAVNELTKLLQSCLTLEEAYQQASRVLQQFFPEGSVLMVNSSRNLLDAVLSWGTASNKQGPFSPEGCWALRKGQYHLTGSHNQNPKCSHSEEKADVCRLCIPMVAQGSSLGILTIADRLFCEDYSPSLSQRKVKLACVFAEQMSLAFANLILRDTLKYQSVRDPLTGLFNRRHMEEVLERELLRAARKSTTATVLMVDIDHFKRFNDSYGHETGDLLLRE